MAVLVTGGAGFVGSHLVDRLVAEGEHVIVCDDLSTGRLANLAQPLGAGKVTFVYLDVAAPLAAINEALAGATKERITSIYHLASPASPEAYGAHPWETLAVNGLGTMSLIDLARERGASMLYCSTSETYGDPLVHPQPESYFGNVNPVGPRACYDEGKRFGEAAMSVAIRERGLDGRIVRIFNCYGPRMDIGDGRLIPSFLGAVQRGEPLPIHGNGRQTRSMTYVDDLVDGLRVVMNTKFSTVQPVNLGSEEENSVNEIAEAVEQMLGTPLARVELPARPEDPQRRRPDITLARSLGWAPRTPLAEGLRRTYDWLTSDALLYV
ncbi:MAG TPA: NAD-dependent epimerase/dehydratase family protein [Candidatus Limnocylindria bacterium]|nr:NAD-dependent epimerase/dehydratase family protein [Candidatus Limnocylindria bacterium]